MRRLLEHYATTAGLPQPISPHRLRHFLLTWLKKQVDDARIQPYSGHASRQSLEIYSRLAIAPMLRPRTPTQWVDSPCRPGQAATLRLVTGTLIPGLPWSMPFSALTPISELRTFENHAIALGLGLLGGVIVVVLGAWDVTRRDVL